MSSKQRLLEYRELQRNGFIIKEVKGSSGKYPTAIVQLCNQFIGKKIKIQIVEEK
jgi:hypothetical protein